MRSEGASISDFPLLLALVTVLSICFRVLGYVVVFRVFCLLGFLKKSEINIWEFLGCSLDVGTQM